MILKLFFGRLNNLIKLTKHLTKRNVLVNKTRHQAQRRIHLWIFFFFCINPCINKNPFDKQQWSSNMIKNILTQLLVAHVGASLLLLLLLSDHSLSFPSSLLCTLKPSLILFSLPPPTPAPPSLRFRPPQREWVSVRLSGEERWVLPPQILFQRNSSSEKHVCRLRPNTRPGLYTFFNPKMTERHTARTSCVHARASFWPQSHHETYRGVSKSAFPRLYMIYTNVNTRVRMNTHGLRWPALPT